MVLNVNFQLPLVLLQSIAVILCELCRGIERVKQKKKKSGCK
jgi:hypothetical protein